VSWLERWRPDERLAAATELRPEALRARGICGIIFDLDSTLGPWGFTRPPPELPGLLNQLERQGLRLAFLSNHSGRGRQALRESLGGRPLIFGAGKPRPAGFLRLLELLELPAGQVAMVGDQLFTDIWGAKRLGLWAILIPSLAPEAEPWPMRPRRLLERMVLGLLDHILGKS